MTEEAKEAAVRIIALVMAGLLMLAAAIVVGAVVFRAVRWII